MKYKAVIFDLDGTLVDSLKDIANAMNKTLKQNSYPTHNLDKYNYLVGKGLRNLTINALPEEARSEENIEKCYNSMFADYSENCTVETSAYPGIEDLLDELTKLELKLGVLSNKAEVLTKKVVATKFPSIDFKEVRGLTTEELKKPNPQVVTEMCENFGVSITETLFVGDTNVDMQTAVNANITPVGVLWGFRTMEELEGAGAKFIVEKPMELVDIVRGEK